MKYVLLIAALFASAQAASEDPVKLLVITGSHGFDPRFYALFEGHKEIEWDKKTQTGKPCAAFTPGFADPYDVVLLYDFEMQATDEQLKAFEDAFGKGRGLIVLHHALCSHPKHPRYREIAGGQFFFEASDGHPKSEYKGGVPMRYEPVPHPVTAGVEPFEAIEEPYKFVYQEEGAAPLLKSANPESDEVVAWATEEGASRVVSIVPGHGGDIFVDPNYRKFIAQAVRWAAGREIPQDQGAKSATKP